MPERIPTDKVFVTHQEMAGILWRIIFAIVGAAVTVITTVAAAVWSISGKFEVVNERFATQAESTAVIRQDVAVIKIQVQGLSSAAFRPAMDNDQAQFVLVQVPHGGLSEESLKELTREVLIRQGQ